MSTLIGRLPRSRDLGFAPRAETRSLCYRLSVGDGQLALYIGRAKPKAASSISGPLRQSGLKRNDDFPNGCKAQGKAVEPEGTRVMKGLGLLATWNMDSVL